MSRIFLPGMVSAYRSRYQPRTSCAPSESGGRARASGVRRLRAGEGRRLGRPIGERNRPPLRAQRLKGGRPVCHGATLLAGGQWAGPSLFDEIAPLCDHPSVEGIPFQQHERCVSVKSSCTNGGVDRSPPHRGYSASVRRGRSRVGRCGDDVPAQRLGGMATQEPCSRVEDPDCVVKLRQLRRDAPDIGPLAL